MVYLILKKIKLTIWIGLSLIRSGLISLTSPKLTSRHKMSGNSGFERNHQKKVNLENEKVAAKDLEGILASSWFPRTFAIFIDYLLIFFITGIAFQNIRFPMFFIPMGIISLGYFTISECILGFTLGKKIFNLQVLTFDGKKVTFKQALIRNISKANVVFLILDSIVGFFTKGNSSQKFTAHFSNTTVNSTTISNPYVNQFKVEDLSKNFEKSEKYSEVIYPKDS